MRVLLADDDPRLRAILEEELGDRQFDVTTVATARDALREGLFAAWSAIVLDVNLPDGDGFTVCSRLREAGVETPVLMLTARDAVPDRVAGLDSGSDDYLVKPFALEELVARLHALARRAPALTAPVITVADLEMDLRTRRVERAGTSIELTAKEFALLEILARNAGGVVDRATITASVWDDNHDPLSNALEVLIRRLRAKIDDAFAEPLIRTVRGAGYRLGP